MTYEECSIFLKVILCLINTGALLTEIYTPVMGVTHSLIGPTAIFTVYILIGSQILSSCFGHYGTEFFQMYSTIACICVELAFSIAVFAEMEVPGVAKAGSGHIVLNGVLPIIMSIFLVADFVLIFCTFHQEGFLDHPRVTFSGFVTTLYRSRHVLSNTSNLSAGNKNV